jgi:1,4-alpha-glucan branching enzyme
MPTLSEQTPATAAAQLKREFPVWAEAKMHSSDNSKNGYWDIHLDLNGSSLACQYCANSGYWVEIQNECGRPIVDSEADYYPSLAEAIAALRQAAAQQMQVLKTLGDAHGK